MATKILQCTSCGNTAQFETVNSLYNEFRCLCCGAFVHYESDDISNRPVTIESLQERAYILLKDDNFIAAKDKFLAITDRAPKYYRGYLGIVLAEKKCVDDADFYSTRMARTVIENEINKSEKYVGNISKEQAESALKAFCGQNLQHAIDFSTTFKEDSEHLNAMINSLTESIYNQYPILKYEYATQLFQSGKYDNILVAIERFEELGSYSDSKAMIAKCKDAIAEQRYQKAMQLYNSNPDDKTLKAIAKEFEKLGCYKDSKAKATEISKYLNLKTVRIVLKRCSMVILYLIPVVTILLGGLCWYCKAHRINWLSDVKIIYPILSGIYRAQVLRNTSFFTTACLICIIIEAVIVPLCHLGQYGAVVLRGFVTSFATLTGMFMLSSGSFSYMFILAVYILLFAVMTIMYHVYVKVLGKPNKPEFDINGVFQFTVFGICQFLFYLVLELNTPCIQMANGAGAPVGPIIVIILAFFAKFFFIEEAYSPIANLICSIILGALFVFCGFECYDISTYIICALIWLPDLVVSPLGNEFS